MLVLEFVIIIAAWWGFQARVDGEPSYGYHSSASNAHNLFAELKTSCTKLFCCAPKNTKHGIDIFPTQ